MPYASLPTSQDLFAEARALIGEQYDDAMVDARVARLEHAEGRLSERRYGQREGAAVALSLLVTLLDILAVGGESPTLSAANDTAPRRSPTTGPLRVVTGEPEGVA